MNKGMVVTLQGVRKVDASTGETTIELTLEGVPIKFIVLADARRAGLRVELPDGLLVGREDQHGTNGEVRERVRFPDGAGCVRTVSKTPGWQNAHRHKDVREDFVILAGRVCLVELEANGQLVWHVYEQGATFQTTPGRAHTLYVCAGADFLVTKYGGGAKDWIAAPELDQLVSSLTEDVLLARFSL